MSRVPKYRRHASGQARVTIDGRDVYLGLYGSPESRRRYAEVIAGLGSDRPPPPPKRGEAVTVAELAARYTDHAAIYYGAGGQLDRVRRSLAVALELYAGERAARFGPVALARVRDRMVEQVWTRASVNSCVGCLRRAWRWAAAQELVPTEVYQSLCTLPGLRRGKSAARESPPVLPVPVADLYAVLALARPTLGAMVRLQLLTGMRPGELCRLTPGQIDTTGDVWVYRPARHKTAHRGKGRQILLGPAARRLVETRMRDADTPVFRPVDAVEEWHAEMRSRRRSKVQPSQTSRKKTRPKRSPKDRYTTNSYAQAVRRLCLSAGVEPWHPNRLRHTAGTWLRDEHGVEAAQILLGHSRPDMTQHYTSQATARLVDLVRRVG